MNGRSSEIPQADCIVRADSAETDEQACDFRKSFFRLSRAWNDGDHISLSFSTAPRVTRWFHSAAVFESGPLVFSLPLKEQWSKLKEYQEKSADWQVTSTSDWNYAVELGACDATISQHPVTAVPFDSAASPVTVHVEAKRYPPWAQQENSAAAPPDRSRWIRESRYRRLLSSLMEPPNYALLNSLCSSEESKCAAQPVSRSR